MRFSEEGKEKKDFYRERERMNAKKNLNMERRGHTDICIYMRMRGILTIYLIDHTYCIVHLLYTKKINCIISPRYSRSNFTQKKKQLLFAGRLQTGFSFFLSPLTHSLHSPPPLSLPKPSKKKNFKFLIQELKIIDMGEGKLILFYLSTLFYLFISLLWEFSWTEGRRRGGGDQSSAVHRKKNKSGE